VQTTLKSVSRSVPSGNIRSLIYKFVKESDALAEWRAELDEWINDIAAFREAENQNFFLPEEVSDATKRYHRMILHSLLATGERLAIELDARSGEVSADEVAKQLEYVETFLDNLRCTLIAFHRNREPKVEKPGLLAKYF
jgi:hypothetical protein